MFVNSLPVGQDFVPRRHIQGSLSAHEDEFHLAGPNPARLWPLISCFGNSGKKYLTCKCIALENLYYIC